jgi:uncharacterized membrane protein (DUF485 family)
MFLIAAVLSFVSFLLCLSFVQQYEMYNLSPPDTLHFLYGMVVMLATVVLPALYLFFNNEYEK